MIEVWLVIIVFVKYHIFLYW